MAFLSLLDDRAKPKGSRDPLGFELVWSHFGRKVIGNLTTITSSLDNFTVALLGFHWANQLAQEGEGAERDKQVRELFLCYEQLTGYIRAYGKADEIMGITRIRRRLSDDAIKITLGTKPPQQILSDQASYGLWGLYSSAARDTGLVTGNDRHITSLGQVIVEALVQRLGDTADTLFQLMQARGPLEKKKLEALGPRFQRALHHRSVRKPLLEALMAGSDRDGVQQELWAITQSLFRAPSKRPATILEFVEGVLASHPSKQLSQRLRHILDVERVLVAANNVFHYCRRKDGERLSVIIDTLKDRYQYDYLPADLPGEAFPHRDQLVSLLDALRNNNMRRLIEELCLLNKEVMQQRSGAPWVELESSQTLRVKVGSETAQLMEQKALENEWDYDYFLGSYLAIASHHVGNA